jgi:hypothetical protein
MPSPIVTYRTELITSADLRVACRRLNFSWDAIRLAAKR